MADDDVRHDGHAMHRDVRWLYAQLHTDQLQGLRTAFLLDIGDMAPGSPTILFAVGRIALIDAELQARASRAPAADASTRPGPAA